MLLQAVQMVLVLILTKRFVRDVTRAKGEAAIVSGETTSGNPTRGLKLGIVSEAVCHASSSTHRNGPWVDAGTLDDSTYSRQHSPGDIGSRMGLADTLADRGYD